MQAYDVPAIVGAVVVVALATMFRQEIRAYLLRNVPRRMTPLTPQQPTPAPEHKPQTKTPVLIATKTTPLPKLEPLTSAKLLARK